MALNRLLTYTLLFFCLQISGQGLLIEQNGQLIRWDTPTGATDSLMMFEFDPVDRSRLAFLSDTSDMELRWSNDTAYVVKWYDVLKRDSLLQATAAFQPRFDFADGSVRFDGGQNMSFVFGPFGESEKYEPFTYCARAKSDTTGDNIYRPIIHYRYIYGAGNYFQRSVYFRNNLLNFDNIIVTGGLVESRTTLGELYNINQYYNVIGTNNEMFIDLVKVTGTGTFSTIRNAGFTFYVGASDGINEFLTGNIRTIILFDFALNKGQRILTNKYLQK